jgi:cation transport ATPase
VARRAKEEGLTVPEATGHRAEPGAGIGASVGGRSVRVGRPDGLHDEAARQADRLARRGLTVFAVWRDEHPVGLVGAADTVKPNAAGSVRRIRSWGWEVGLVSGDRRRTVEGVAREAGIDRSVAEVFPEGKVEEIRRLQEMGKRVAFVGDGINDAPALAQADLGIALRSGTDVAREAGDVLILGPDLGLVVDCLVLARKTYWVIWQNLSWAFTYNALMIPLALVGAVSPMVAAGAMAGSSVTVVANALRLRRYAGGRGTVAEEDGLLDPSVERTLERLREAARRPAGPTSPPGLEADTAPVAEAARGLTGDSRQERPPLRQTMVRLADFVTKKWGEQWDT